MTFRVESVYSKHARLVVLAVVVLLLAGRAAVVRADETRCRCAVDPLDAEFEEEYASEPSGFPDPLEPVNRSILGFNQVVDHWVIGPVADVYGFLMPEPAKVAVQNFFENLNSPAILVNDLLQREWRDAGTTATRFFVNTTVGVCGFVDMAKRNGLPGHDSDFGQTLALMGTPSGPFLVLPLLGPTTVRDGTGNIVDLFFRPTTWFLGAADQVFFYTIHGGGQGIVLREAQSSALEALEESSIDYYAALRNAYYQHRIAAIWARREDHRPAPAGGEDDGENAGWLAALSS